MEKAPERRRPVTLIFLPFSKNKPPPDDPNEAAKALVDQVAALTEDDEPEPQDQGSARPHRSDKASESDRS